MKVCLKRFQVPLFLAVLIVLMFGAAVNGDKSGALSAFMIFILFPAFAFFFLRAVCLLLWDIYRVKFRGEDWPEDKPSYLERILNELRNMPPDERGDFIRTRILGMSVMILGAITALKDHAVIGTLLLIAGLYIWQSDSKV